MLHNGGIMVNMVNMVNEESTNKFMLMIYFILILLIGLFFGLKLRESTAIKSIEGSQKEYEASLDNTQSIIRSQGRLIQYLKWEAVQYNEVLLIAMQSDKAEEIRNYVKNNENPNVGILKETIPNGR
jgi:hypothetical protein